MKKDKSGWLAPKRRKEREVELDKLTKKMISTDLSRMNVLVPANLYAKFKSLVFSRRQRINDVIIDFIKKYVEDPDSFKTSNEDLKK